LLAVAADCFAIPEAAQRLSFEGGPQFDIAPRSGRSGPTAISRRIE